MKHTSVCVCAGTLLVAAPMLLGAYHTYEFAQVAQSFAVNHYMGNFNPAPAGMVWEVVSLAAGSILIAYGIIAGAIELRRGGPEAAMDSKVPS